MVLYSYPSEVDKTPFIGDVPGSPRYGLPGEVKYCRSCVISNQRPSSTIEFKNDGSAPKKVINFDEFDICDACRVTTKKNEIDWKSLSELRDLCDRFEEATVITIASSWKWW